MAKRTKTPKPTQEELIRAHLEYRKSDMQESFIPEPTRIFEVGQKVEWGNHDETIIEEVFDGGKFYLVRYTNFAREKGAQGAFDSGLKETQTSRHVTAWTDLFPLLGQDKSERLEDETYDTLNFSQRDIQGLLLAYYSPGIDMEPSYQRDYCWGLDDKRALIQSIFDYVEIGKFALIFRGYATRPIYEILDGKQRLRALLDFYEDRFDFRGKRFSELHPGDRNHFKRYPVSWAEAREKMTEEQKLQYFLRLNVGGVPQDPKHLDRIRERYEALRKARLEGQNG